MDSPASYQPEETDLCALQQDSDLECLSLTNADLPIHMLPAEVLIQIFQHFLPSHHFFVADPKTNGRLKRPWARLMGVCRHWCALIKGAACFWRDIEVRSKDVRWLTLALRRLGDAPARIALFHNLKTALPILMERAENVEALSFKGSMHDPGVASILSWPSSILYSLEVSLERSYHPARSKLPEFNCSSRRLVELSLTRASLPWSTSILAGLEVLSLSHCQLSTPPLAFGDFLDVLEHGQSLRDLYLKNFLSAAVSPRTSVSRQRLVALPRIRRITFHDDPARVAQLMAHLHTPALSEIALEGECSNPDDPSIADATLSSLLPEDLTRVPILRSVSSVALEVKHEGRKLYASGPSPIDLRLFLHKPPASWARELDEEMRRLPAVFGPALTILELSGTLDFSPRTWDVVFDAFPALQTLKLHHVQSRDVLELPPGLFCALQTGPDLPNGVGEAHIGVRCPALKEVTLYPVWWKSQTMDTVLECLRCRVAEGAQRLERLSLGVDPRLSDSMDMEDDHNRGRFCEYVGEVALWCW